MRAESAQPPAGSAASDAVPVRSDRDAPPPEPAAGSGSAASPGGPPVAAGGPAEPPDASHKPGTDDKNHRRPATRPATVRRPVATADDKDAKTAPALARQAKALESAGKWEEARAAYQRLEKFRPYRSEAMYGQAWTAFQMNDTHMAEQIAGQLATEGGPFKIKAEFLYADALFRQAQYSRAKVIYQKLRGELRGDQRAMAQKKIVACNKELKLPENDGVGD